MIDQWFTAKHESTNVINQNARNQTKIDNEVPFSSLEGGTDEISDALRDLVDSPL